MEIYCPSLTTYQRLNTRCVNVGDVGVGGKNPIRIQSMTTTNTMDTENTISQSIRMIEAGCEIVRITAPSIKEAENLKNIKEGLRKRGYKTPLVADIHFTPNAAKIAAKIVEKVRINPGNYADRKNFKTYDYTDKSYINELERIRERFIPLVRICKENGTSMRIGTNHGSLSDRIMSRYGDSPLGMVESAMEFIRIAEDEGYKDIILSMKSSNTQVMVQAYRLLVKKMNDEQMNYPLHLGVTEAGEAEDGRIKSAVGIGTLLDDGLGDTIRVSLSDDPPIEAKVGNEILKSLNLRNRGVKIISCPSCARQAFPVINTVKLLEEKLSHIKTPITLSIIGCVVNGPGEAAMTDIGITGGGKGSNMLYLSGIQSEKVLTDDIISKVVSQVEKKAKEIKNNS